ncbi:cyclodeaminase/cyclohydrolase family protein [Ligilactobacillus acidipiscis]|uniref:cyclodeaminase/cyclohydrolase family protein n=1 Tax=Ligilactobacillus acidipiscis TaxID=89059 RepID=UPI0023F6CB56|nr:cyclodeaminase/cyclohydrolase family protein [Ligilactobacillus acidipiscis]WEV56218.1 cyclodeaminase/cyclohydrolase family protein [Ligilactobacillus acidipiscis]
MKTVTIDEFISRLSSKTPTPGGGAACALVAALGSCLGSMVGHIKEEKHPANELSETLKKMEDVRTQLLQLVDNDAAAFGALSKTLKMPKDTVQQKQARQEQLAKDLVAAAQVPLNIEQAIVLELKVMQEMKEFSSKSLLSDIGCGATLSMGALNAAILNVYVNTKLMKDKKQAGKFNQQAEKLARQGSQIAQQLYGEVEASVKG